MVSHFLPHLSVRIGVNQWLKFKFFHTGASSRLYHSLVTMASSTAGGNIAITSPSKRRLTAG